MNNRKRFETQVKLAVTVSENIPDHTINSVTRYRQSLLRHQRLVKEKESCIRTFAIADN